MTATRGTLYSGGASDGEALGGLTHDGCGVEKAIALLAKGRARLEAIHHADCALRHDFCSKNSRCIWGAMTTLLAAGEVVIAEGHWQRLVGRHLDGCEPLLLLVRAQITRLVGDLHGARDEFEKVISAPAPLRIHQIALPWLIETLAVLGELEQAAELVKETDIDRIAGRKSPNQALLLGARGVLNLRLGRDEDAMVDLLAAGRGPVVEHSASPVLSRWRSLAGLGARESRPELATKLVTAERGYALRWGAPIRIGWALSAYAIVAGHERTIELLEDAAEVLEIAGGRVELPFVCRELGKRCAEAGDTAGARNMFERALGMAKRLGNTALADEITQHLVQVAPHKPEELTRREKKIAKLARAGHSNKEIASKLALTVRTVEFHLSSVYRKLLISGRRELMSPTVNLD
ncbi:LuxR C-terminal-related transcriptional regulator [Amycolatopsis sp. cg5]|uniref:helix-turn-helix transcriptional regulator n=1 Tax=Amycolatopsis sp. cg5 TaxID=3238802 RepID=UPI003523F63C